MTRDMAVVQVARQMVNKLTAVVATKVDKGELLVIDTDYASLALALAATATGGTLEVRGTYSVTSPFVINKECEVRFAHGAQITATTGHGISITASGVTLTRPRVRGSGSGTAGTYCGIRAVGTVGSPITDLQITLPNIANFNKYGIYFEHVHDFSIRRPAINSIAYGAIMLLSCMDGEIQAGAIRTLTMPSGFTNAYGIAMTYDSSASEAVAPSSARITVNRVLIEDVPWEAIDTHAGVDLTITNNIIRGCLNGVALVPGEGAGGPDRGPKRCLIANNNINSLATDGSKQDGIKVVGAGSVAGSPVDSAAGCVIIGNTITGHGEEASGLASAGISFYFTQGLVVSGNGVIEPGVRGIHAYHTNNGALIIGNTITDVWTNSAAACAAIQVRSTDNTATISGNHAVRGSKSATLVNDRGLWVNSGTNNTFVESENNFTTCTTPMVDTSNTCALWSRAKKVGFYGVTPVVRPASPGTAAGTDAAVINALITALRSQGLLT